MRTALDQNLHMRIPERTIDSMVAIEVTRLEPSAIIFSPTNTKGAVDHLVQRRYAETVLECKGVDDQDRIPIDLKQLWEYVYGRGPRETIYLLPSRPPNPRPWQRKCSQPCCDGIGCRFCPRDARSWTGLDPWVRAMPEDDQVQPWFAHWSWCVPSRSLADRFGLDPRVRTSGNSFLPWDDADLGALDGAARLCHWFGTSTDGPRLSRALRSAMEGPPDIEPLRRPETFVDFEASPPLVVAQAAPADSDT